MYLRYELQRPLELARHGYRTPFDALQDKVRSILTQILAHLGKRIQILDLQFLPNFFCFHANPQDYSSMARSRNFATDAINDPSHQHDADDVGTVFVTAVRTQATDELRIVAADYGIKIEDLAIIGTSKPSICNVEHGLEKYTAQTENLEARSQRVWTGSPPEPWKLKSNLPTLTEKTITGSLNSKVTLECKS